MRSKICMMVLPCLLALASAIAHADAAVTVKSEVVRYDDLRLISTVGAAVLYGRIRAAAERTCGVTNDKRPVGHETKVRACVEEAIAKAVTDVNEPQLNYYYETKRARPAQASTPTPNKSTVANTH